MLIVAVEKKQHLQTPLCSFVPWVKRIQVIGNLWSLTCRISEGSLPGIHGRIAFCISAISGKTCGKKGKLGPKANLVV